MIKFEIKLTQYKQDIYIQPKQLDTKDISDYVTEIQYTYSIKAPYEQATLRAKMPFPELYAQLGKTVTPPNSAFLDFITMYADGWATIYELDTEANTRQLRFFGVVSSINSGLVADQNGLKSTIDLTISLSSWISVLQTPIKLVLSEYYKAKGLGGIKPVYSPSIDYPEYANQDFITGTRGVYPDVEYYGKLDAILKNFLDPKDAIKQWYSLFTNFMPDTQITNKSLMDVIFLTRNTDLKKYGVSQRTLTDIVTFNFDTLFPALNNSILSAMTSSFQGEMDSVIELFPSYEEVTTNEGLFSDQAETAPPTKQIQPVLIYRYRPLPSDYQRGVSAINVSLNQGEIQSETRVNDQGQYEVVYTREGGSLNFTAIKPDTRKPIEINTVNNLSISWNAGNRLNLINVSTRASGVNNILGVTTDFYIDEESIKKYGVFSYEATYPFFGSTQENKKIRDFATELTTYVRLLLGSGETYGNAQCTSYYEPKIKQGEYVRIGVSYGVGNVDFPNEYYIGYCTQVTHNHKALPDGRIQRSSSFTLERFQIYQEA
jgi:hypothetical protein